MPMFMSEPDGNANYCAEFFFICYLYFSFFNTFFKFSIDKSNFINYNMYRIQQCRYFFYRNSTVTSTKKFDRLNPYRVSPYKRTKSSEIISITAFPQTRQLIALFFYFLGYFHLRG